MASRNVTLSRPQNSFSSSFSIKNILKLPEESTAKCNRVSADHTETNRFSGPSISLFPRVARSMAYHNGSNSSPCTLRICGDFSALSCLYPTAQVDQFPFPRSGYDLGIDIFQRERRQQARIGIRRPVFSVLQTQTMEKEFAKCPYVTVKKRAELALELNMTETQVKTWFQNRRTKWKRETKEKCGPPVLERQKYWEDAYKQRLEQKKSRT